MLLVLLNDIMVLINIKEEKLMSFVFREAEGKDAEALVKYITTVGGETDYLSYGKDTFNISPEREARFIERFKRNKKDIMLIALDGESVIANASLESNRVQRYSHSSELSITVLKEYWGRGIGSRLMEMMIDFARSVGTEIIYLEARSDNERAFALYQKFGFEKNCDIKRFFKIDGKYYDATVMTLYL